MNLGGRIAKRLKELGWERSGLLALVPDLSPATLSALIVRDSRRSEYDAKIAAALGVTLEWLNTGQGAKLLEETAQQPDKSPELPLNVKQFPANNDREYSAELQEIIRLVSGMEPAWQGRAVERIKSLADERKASRKAKRVR